MPAQGPPTATKGDNPHPAGSTASPCHPPRHPGASRTQPGARGRAQVSPAPPEHVPGALQDLQGGVEQLDSIIKEGNKGDLMSVGVGPGAPAAGQCQPHTAQALQRSQIPQLQGLLHISHSASTESCSSLFPLLLRVQSPQPTPEPPGKGGWNCREPRAAWAPHHPGATSTLSRSSPSPSLPSGTHPRDWYWSGEPNQAWRGCREHGEEEGEEEEAALTPAAKPRLPSRIRLWK